MIECITLEVQGNSEQVQLVMAWFGGQCSEHILIRPVAKLTQLSYDPQVCQRIRELAAQQLDATSLATQLNQEGFRPPKRRETFNAAGVRVLQRLDLVALRKQTKAQPELEPHNWTIAELARIIDMPYVSLYNWARQGLLQAWQVPSSKRWLIWADEAEIKRLKARHQRPPGYDVHRRWLEASQDLAQT